MSYTAVIGGVFSVCEGGNHVFDGSKFLRLNSFFEIFDTLRLLLAICKKKKKNYLITQFSQ